MKEVILIFITSVLFVFNLQSSTLKKDTLDILTENCKLTIISKGTEIEIKIQEQKTCSPTGCLHIILLNDNLISSLSYFDTICNSSLLQSPIGYRKDGIIEEYIYLPKVYNMEIISVESSNLKLHPSLFGIDAMDVILQNINRRKGKNFSTKLLEFGCSYRIYHDNQTSMRILYSNTGRILKISEETVLSSTEFPKHGFSLIMCKRGIENISLFRLGKEFLTIVCDRKGKAKELILENRGGIVRVSLKRKIQILT